MRIKNFLLLAILLASCSYLRAENGKLIGNLKFNKSWENRIFLSYIPTFEDMFSMSNQMIIAEAVIDSLGNFEFELGFIPEETRLFRLHIVKKGDAKTTLIIGGVDENHWFFIANRNSHINIKTVNSGAPFRNIQIYDAEENEDFQKVTDLVFTSDSIASVSGAAKRKFVEDRLFETLQLIADSSTHPLVSLYAIYNSDVDSNLDENKQFYSQYLDKWEGRSDPYYEAFRAKIPASIQSGNTIKYVFLAIVLLLIGFVIGRFSLSTNKRIKKLSVQERKVYELLRQGATNQEISDQYNIGLSTVKSHVSSILSKLNVKSRKEIMNLK